MLAGGLKGAQTLSGRNEVLVNQPAESIAPPNADFNASPP
jgi:hypothetical protein